jgi:hypothetical protein
MGGKSLPQETSHVIQYENIAGDESAASRTFFYLIFMRLHFVCAMVQSIFLCISVYHARIFGKFIKNLEKIFILFNFLKNTIIFRKFSRH